MKGNPRYALVRVDGTTHCPSRYEKINKDFVCSGLPHCYKCRYGDTKEQLIAKVETAIRRLQADKNRIIVGYDMWAKFIVEFLGVSE